METITEKRVVKRAVTMGIKPSAGADSIRINAVFDMSALSDAQIADWAVSANGVRVWFQNKYRPKGRDYLLELSKKEQVIVVPPCGTRTGEDTTTAMLAKFANMSNEEQDAYILELQNRKKEGPEQAPEDKEEEKTEEETKEAE